MSRPTPPSPLNGLLVIDKPAGWTSHDVVARVRRLAGTRRVGHAGTLDPAATGVLPLGIGTGTRVLEYLSDAGKSYQAAIVLGATTTTDDAEGTVMAHGDWQAINEAAVRAALTTFVGTIIQVPPAYSAIKRDGVPLHRLARTGMAVAPPPRMVIIHRITVDAVELPKVMITVECGKGTYIRSLARDLGAALGCGGHLGVLRRRRSGPFSLTQAVTLAQVAAAAADGSLGALLLPIDAGIADLPAVQLDATDTDHLCHGRTAPRATPTGSGTLARALDSRGRVIAIIRAADGVWEPVKVFAGAGGRAQQGKAANAPDIDGPRGPDEPPAGSTPPPS